MKMQRLFAGIATMMLVCCVVAQSASAGTIFEDFDGGGNTAFALTNSGGAPPTISNGGPTGNYVRLANLTGSINNSIAFDENPSASGPQPAGVKLRFDFRMTGDVANNDAGGCCNSAADGLGIGLFATSVYGAAGGANPPTMNQGSTAWERPAFNGAFTVGLDVFERIDQINLNWNGAEVANADVQSFLDLNNNVLHRAVVDIKPDGANALVDMQILEDIHGATTVHQIFSNQSIAGMDLNSMPGFRLIAGARTGGAFLSGDLDNIFVSAVPEPSSMVLLAISALGLLGLRRRR